MKSFEKCLAVLMLCLMLTGCAAGGADEPRPTEKPPESIAIPERLDTTDDGVPVLRVYVKQDEQISDMDIETYLLGVLAGEMKNDWPLEALKAQAVLARTFTLKFVTEKHSRYEGADISTDISEAQAYDAAGVNDRVRRAVSETRGVVMLHGSELPYAWFHAHSGGMTAMATEGLNYDDDPAYIHVVSGNEWSGAPASAREWERTFTEQEILKAARTLGFSGDALESISVGERGASGRAVTILINGQSVSAPELRIALGSERMRSTLLTSLKITGGGVYISGKGFGHGVGMPQWGAYGMADQGYEYEQIVRYYFQDVSLRKAW